MSLNNKDKTARRHFDRRNYAIDTLAQSEAAAKRADKPWNGSLNTAELRKEAIAEKGLTVGTRIIFTRIIFEIVEITADFHLRLKGFDLPASPCNVEVAPEE